ncbi:MAG: NAD(P)H-dependent oxidoreductase subunit E [Anaerolineae bacterium]
MAPHSPHLGAVRWPSPPPCPPPTACNAPSPPTSRRPSRSIRPIARRRRSSTCCTWPRRRTAASRPRPSKRSPPCSRWTRRRSAASSASYSLFKEEPHGRMVVHYCTDLPCALRGAEAFLPEVCRAFGVAKPGETSPDGLFSVEEAMCLAACDRAPMMQVNLSYFHDLTPERLDGIVALRAKAAARPGPGAPYGLGSVADVAD